MDELELAKCRSWATAPSRHWQLLNRAKWKYQFRGAAMVRYVDEVKMDEGMVRLMLDYLVSDDCIADLESYNQGLTPQNAWKPTKAWYEISQKLVNGVRSVRLYQALTTNPEANRDGPFVVEDGCAYQVTLTYFFGVSSVPRAPASTSGVSYRISGVQRDPDTDLLNYVLEKRERVQQDIEEYFTSKGVYRDTTEEVHLGVKESRVEAEGKQASVSPGEKVHRKVTKNADCTKDVQNTTEKSHPVVEASKTVAETVEGQRITIVNRNMRAPAPTDNLAPGESVANEKNDDETWNQIIRRNIFAAFRWIAEHCRKTVYVHTHSGTVVVKDDPGFTHTVEAQGGVIVEKSVQKVEGGYRITTNTTTANAVPSASVSTHVGLDGVTETTTNRNMSAPAPTDGLDVGESVENRKTDGGLWDTIVRRVLRRALLRLGTSCAKTIFAHRHSSSWVQGSDPGFADVDEAADGVIHQASVSRTSSGGYRVEENATTEKPVLNARTTWRMTLYGLIKSVLHRNQSVVPDPASLKVGESLSVAKTDGGLYDVQTESAPVSGAGRIGESCQQDIFTHRHDVQENVAASVDANPETRFANGRIVRKSVSVQGNGTKNVSTDTTTAKPVRNEYSWVSGGVKYHVVKYRNQPSMPVRPGSYGTCHRNDEINAFGLHDGSLTWTDAPDGGVSGIYTYTRHGPKHGEVEFLTDKFGRHYVRTVYTQRIYKCGKYSEYVDMLAEGENPKLIRGAFKDSFGNLYCEWSWEQTMSDDGGNIGFRYMSKRQLLASSPRYLKSLGVV